MFNTLNSYTVKMIANFMLLKKIFNIFNVLAINWNNKDFQPTHKWPVIYMQMKSIIIFLCQVVIKAKTPCIMKIRHNGVWNSTCVLKNIY